MKGRALTLSAVLALSACVRAGAHDLETCIAAALRENPGTRAALHRAEAARAAHRAAAAAYYPRVTASGAYTRTDNPPQAFTMTLNQRDLSFDGDFNDPDDTDNLRLSLGARVELLNAVRDFGVGASRLQAGAAEAQHRAARNALVHEVVRAYYGLLQAQALVTVQEENVAGLEESRRVARERFDAGTTVKTDVLNLEVRLAEAREDLIRSRNRVRLSVLGLNTAIGRDLVGEEGLPPREGPVDLPPPPGGGNDGEGVRNRPEAQAAAFRAQAGDRMRRQARAGYLPRVYAFGSLDWDSGEVSDFEDSYLVGVAAEWTLFTGFERRHAVRAATAKALEAAALQDDMLNRLRLDLRAAVLGAGEAWERLDVGRKSLASAEEALRITGERYRQGAADITELLTAQVGRTASHHRHVVATYDYLIAVSNVERARGLLAQRRATARAAQP